MPKIARIHNNPNTNIQGIDRSDVVNPATMFQGVPDPLLDGGTMLASKVGSSIPNMFARMVFFKTAFSSIRQVNIPQGADIPEYNRLVSQCLDLLEMLFNNDQNIKPVCFDFANQIARLRNSQWGAHRHFAEVLEEQRSQSIPDVQSMYLFVDNDNKIIGGTSPFTMVYTSPNWESGLPVRSLQERDDTFKQFVYRLLAAYTAHGDITPNSPFSAFSNYVNAIANAEHVNFVGYTVANLQADYDVYMDGNNIVYCAMIPVYKRKKGEFSSDFFIHSTRLEFNRDTTPLALTEGPHPGMYYYDRVLWSQNIEVPQVGRAVYKAIEDKDMALPECNAHKHDFITDVDIFEDKLVALPYPIDSSRFGKTIAIDDKYNALLPIRPIYFLYFSVADLDNQLSITKGADYCELTLNMPVFDGATRNNTIVFRKRYDFAADVQYLMVKGTQTSFNVGISPFYKLPNLAQNNYWIMGAIDDVARFSMRIKFYRHGERSDYENPNGLSTLYYNERSRAPQTFYANIVHFDVLQIELTEKQNPDNKVRCILLPHFLEVPSTGIQKFYYGIDFGTTNSHVAYVSDNEADPGSFSEKEYATAVTYLNVTDTVVNNVPIYHEDTLRLNKAREFYPQQSSRYNCTFPIRTAISISGALDANSQLFGNASIGFHFGKEIISQPFYETKLKWNLMNDPASAAAQSAVRVFFNEILLMIRHHWMSQTTANHTSLPKIRITFPKLSSGATAMTHMWKEAYQAVFGQLPTPQNEYLTTMVESLAPCVQSINKGGESLKTSGLLNMDIGGGTTDIQYYKQVGQKLDSCYDSILFAGDDLWGQDFENMSPLINSTAIKPNNFTNVAREHLVNAAISIDNANTNIGAITLNGKELINCLFRDQNNNFSTVLSDENGGTDVRKCRMQMTMHYSAIIYHIANWLKVNELTIPSVLRASGLGSKYLSLLFPQDNLATAYTRYLFEKFWPTAPIPQDFKVEITNNQGINPKVITAEGAALSLKNGVNLATPIKASHLGMANYTVGYKFGDRPIQVGDTNDAGVQNSAAEFFNTFVDTMCSLDLNTDVPLVAKSIPTLSAEEGANMKANGLQSIQTIATSYYNSPAHRTDNLDESMMVWAMKDSLWKL